MRMVEEADCAISAAVALLAEDDAERETIEWNMTLFLQSNDRICETGNDALNAKLVMQTTTTLCLLACLPAYT